MTKLRKLLTQAVLALTLSLVAVLAQAAPTRYWVVGPVGPDYFAVPNDPAPTSYRLKFKVGFFGDQVPGFVRVVNLEVEVLFTDAPLVIASKLVDQVQAVATALGHSVVRTDGLIPTYQRGLL